MAKLRMAHASTHGARKPPGPKVQANVLNKHKYKHQYRTSFLYNLQDLKPNYILENGKNSFLLKLFKDGSINLFDIHIFINLFLKITMANVLLW